MSENSTQKQKMQKPKIDAPHRFLEIPEGLKGGIDWFAMVLEGSNCNPKDFSATFQAFPSDQVSEEELEESIVRLCRRYDDSETPDDNKTGWSAHYSFTGKEIKGNNSLICGRTATGTWVACLGVTILILKDDCSGSMSGHFACDTDDFLRLATQQHAARETVRKKGKSDLNSALEELWASEI